MIVCQCRGISDRQIRRAVREGADTARAVVQASGVGTGCGGCRSTVLEIIDEERQRAACASHDAAIVLEIGDVAAAAR